MTLRCRLLLGLLLLAPFTRPTHAQAVYAGVGPGSYVNLGTTFAATQTGYGHQKLGGFTLYADANLFRCVGIEAEFRSLTLHAQQGVRESAWLIGPRLATRGRTIRPFAKLLVGRANFTFPFGYAQGSYLVIAPGVGLDWRIPRSRLTIRLADVEWQQWMHFTFGQQRPYTISTGFSYTLTSPHNRER